MRRRLNLKFLVGLLLAGLLLGASLSFLYGFQSRRHADSLLERADQAEEEGDTVRCRRLLERFLVLQPRNERVLERYGLLLAGHADSTATRQLALASLNQVLRRHPERADLRRWRVRLRMALGRFTDLKEDLTSLGKSFPEDGEIEDWWGQSEEAAGKATESAEWYARAIEHAPTRIESYPRLASLMRSRLDQPKEADKVMDDLIAANGRSAQAYLVRARYRQVFQSPREAGKDLAQARSLAPDRADVLLLSGQMAQACGEVEAACGHLQRGLALYPTSAPFCSTLASVEQQAGRHAEAVACLRRGLQTVDRVQRNDLLLSLLDVLIQGNDLAEAEEVLNWFHQTGTSPLVQFHQARLLIRKGQWCRAAALLQEVRPRLLQSPALGVSVYLLLGDCYGKIGDLDQQLETHKNAVSLDPQSAPARLALGTTLFARGDSADAVREFRQMMTIRGAPASGWTLLARALLVHNLGLPAEQREWKELTEVLDRATRAEPTAEVVVLRAEVLAAQGQTDQGRKLLEAARDQQPKQVILWVALADWAERQRQPKTADALLDEARQKLGVHLELALARVRFSVRRGGAASQALARLEQELEQYAPADRQRLLAALAGASLQIGQASTAERLWSQAAELEPHNLGIRLALFDLALSAGKKERMQRLLDDMKRIEGEEGTWWRYAEAAQRIAQAARGDRGGLDQAIRRLGEIARRRPRWLRMAVLEAEVLELQGHPEEALEKYQQAVFQGDRQPVVVQRLVRLLYDRQRYRDADQVIRKLQERSVLPEELGQLAPEIALRVQDAERALSLAQQAVSVRAKDYRNHLYLGLSLWGLNRRPESEASLRHALELAPEVPETWVALIHFLAGTDRKDKAEATLVEAEKKLPALPAALPLAQCCEAVGRLDQAAKHYEAALTANPDDAVVLRGIASFYLRAGQLPRAEPSLRKLTRQLQKPDGPEKQGEVESARRNLALVLGRTAALSGGGDYQRFREALELLDANGASPSADLVDDRHARALVLATRSTFHRKAIEILEGLAARELLTPEDQFLLAQLHEGQGNWKAADRWMESFLTANGTSRFHLAYYARSKLRRKEASAAQPRLEKLEALYPRSWETAEIKARMLQAGGKNDEAVALLKKFLEPRAGVAPEADAIGLVASLLEELGLVVAAEELYREYTSRSERPESVLQFVAFFGRQKRVKDALDLCEQARKKCSPAAVAAACVAVLRSAKAGAEHVKRVAGWLESAIEKSPEPALLLSLASVRDLQGRYDDAAALYRRALEADRDNVAALNNLAWQLALRGGDAVEALRLINRALDHFGPDARLLDTRAVVYLAAGESEAALRDLGEAIAQKRAALYSFHLAQAQSQAKDPKAARAALRTAQQEGLAIVSLHPLERASYQQLLVEMEK